MTFHFYFAVYHIYIGSGTARLITVETRMFQDCAGIAPTPSRWRHGCSRRLPGLSRYLTAFPVTPGESRTPASNLGYLAPPPPHRTIFHGCQIVYWDPWMENEGVLQKKWFGLCEIAWFLLQPIANLRRGVCLQNISVVSYPRLLNLIPN